MFVSALIVVGGILPNVIRNFLKTRKGEYTNFDVSVRAHRHSMYLFAIPLLGTIVVVFYITGQSADLTLSTLFVLILLTIAFAVIFKIKCSGHVYLTIYLAFLIYTVNMPAAIIVLLLSGLIGWSRVELKRHTVKEVFAGAAIGLTVGIIMLIAEGIINI